MGPKAKTEKRVRSPPAKETSTVTWAWRFRTTEERRRRLAQFPPSQHRDASMEGTATSESGQNHDAAQEGAPRTPAKRRHRSPRRRAGRRACAPRAGGGVAARPNPGIDGARGKTVQCGAGAAPGSRRRRIEGDRHVTSRCAGRAACDVRRDIFARVRPLPTGWRARPSGCRSRG